MMFQCHSCGRYCSEGYRSHCFPCMDEGLEQLKLSREAKDGAVKSEMDRVDCDAHGSSTMIKLGNKRICRLCGFDPRIGGDTDETVLQEDPKR